MKNTVYLCDCMDYMKGLPDNAFDLAIVDPPYGIHINMNMGRRALAEKVHADKDWDESRPSPEYFTELARISINRVIWGGNYFSLPVTSGWIFWDKQVPVGVSFADGELAWSSFGKTLRKAVIPYSGFTGSEGKIHPTQKPVALYKWLLKNYAKPGQSIFDSHVGSGSIRIACHDMGYNFTGCELDPDYHAAQEDRFNTHKAQGQLFDPVELTKNEYIQVAL